MDTRRSAAALSPIKSVREDATIIIDGRPVNAHNVRFPDASIVIANFRKLIFELFPQDTARNLKLQDLGDYNISFFNSPGDDRTQIIFKDALFRASLDAKEELEQWDLSLKKHESELAQEQEYHHSLATSVGAARERLLAEHRNLTREESNTGRSADFEAKDHYQKSLGSYEENVRRLGRLRESLISSRERFTREVRAYKRAYEKSRREYRPVTYDVLQLEARAASYGTSKIAEDQGRDHKYTVESAISSDFTIFESSRQQDDGAENDLGTDQIKLRVFKALLDLEALAQELLARPKESAIMRAIVAAAPLDLQSPAAAARPTLPPLAAAASAPVSLFTNLDDFGEQLEGIFYPPQKAARDLPPVGKRPSTAKFRSDSVIPPIADTAPTALQPSAAAEAEEGEDEDEAGAAADHASPMPLAVADIVAPPPSPASSEESAAEEEIEYADDFEEEDDEDASDNESEESSQPTPDEEEESSQPTPDEEEETKTAPLDAAALDQLTANITFDDDSDEDEEEPSPAGAARADETETAAEHSARVKAGERAVAESMEKLRRKVLGLDNPKAKTDKDRRAEAAYEKALTEDRMWNFATYIYTGHLKSKQSVSNDKGYCNIQNRGTARAKHKDDIIIMAKTTAAPLILHCRRPNSFKLFQINEKTGKKALVDTFDAQRPEKFDNFINNVAAIKGLTEAQKEKVLQGEMKIDAKPKPPTTARPATSRAAGGRASSAYKSPAAAIATSPYAKAPAATASSATASAEKTPLRPTPPPPRPTTAAARPTTAARPARPKTAARPEPKSTPLAEGNAKSKGQTP